MKFTKTMYVHCFIDHAGKPEYTLCALNMDGHESFGSMVAEIEVEVE